MVSDDSSATSGRHTARKQAARELAGRTGMKYTEALRHGAQRTPRWGLDPVYECDWCAEHGDAREVDSSIRLRPTTRTCPR